MGSHALHVTRNQRNDCKYWDQMSKSFRGTQCVFIFQSVSFTAYLINTYDTGVGSRPILRSYIAFEYTNSSTNLSSLRPFVGELLLTLCFLQSIIFRFIGFRGLNGLTQIFNDPSSSINAAFLSRQQRKSRQTIMSILRNTHSS